ncbi:hypothetical protein CSUI_009677 [Cystoisospora suis]|uniref:Transmembrane protein n=1 Tax=Cystoisospora suis TaxID=483139 RepID=A0A2C6KIN8_9APIC|nr:hypothetical protein CSUI_009677 [Cystoisospora suis]
MHSIRKQTYTRKKRIRSKTTLISSPLFLSHSFFLFSFSLLLFSFLSLFLFASLDASSNDKLKRPCLFLLSSFFFFISWP